MSFKLWINGMIVNALRNHSVDFLHIWFCIEKSHMSIDNIFIVADCRAGLSLLGREFMNFTGCFIN